MTKGNDQGKKIDEVSLAWDTKLVVRYHADNQDFTVEAGDQSQRGEDLKKLIEWGTVHMKGWSNLKWEPVIRITTEVYSELSFNYQRMYRSKHKGADVYRHWKVGEVNEGEFGSRYRDDEHKTADQLNTGKPGSVSSCRGEGRIMPYTDDLWCQLRKLSEMLKEASRKASEKLSELLKKRELPAILQTMTGLEPLGLQFKGKS